MLTEEQEKEFKKIDLAMSKMKRPVSEERWIGGVKEVRTFIMDNLIDNTMADNGQ